MPVNGLARIDVSHSMAGTRKLRKGTRSCVECESNCLIMPSAPHAWEHSDHVCVAIGRRRKIRCDYVDESVCVHCKLHGTSCVSQQPSDEGNEALTLRERVARLETQDIQEPPSKRHQTQSSTEQLERAPDSADISTPSLMDHHVPLISILDNERVSCQRRKVTDCMVRSANRREISAVVFRPDEVSASSSSSRPVRTARPAPEIHDTSDQHGSQTRCFKDSRSREKSSLKCQTLREKLPSYDTVIKCFSENETWWAGMEYKIGSVGSAAAESLFSLAQNIYTSNSPAELGILVAAFARSAGGKEHLYSVVEDLVIEDSACLFTVEGLQCLIVLAKAYLDAGKPRRAWLLWRKGVMAAQLSVCHSTMEILVCG